MVHDNPPHSKEHESNKWSFWLAAHTIFTRREEAVSHIIWCGDVAGAKALRDS